MCNDMIEQYESFSEIAYKCPAGIWTYGFGSTRKADGTPVQQGDTISKDGARALLTDYLIHNVYPVYNKIPYKLTNGQKDAIASLCYNIGTSAFLKSKLFKAICEKDIEGIFKNWDWIKGGGKVLKGLAKRRANEMHLFLKDL